MISRNRALPIRLKGLTVRLNNQIVVSQVTWHIEPRSIVGLIGPTGSGKSTLLKLISGIIKSDAGIIRGIPKLKSLMFQEGALFDSLTVFDNIAFPLVNGKVPVSLLGRSIQREISDKVFSILARVGLDWAAYKMPSELSGGMRRRVSLARSLVTKPALALLDDPTSGLDPVASSVILDLIVDLQRELGSTMIVASHDLRRLIPRCGRIGCLYDGELAFSGTVDDLRICNDERVSRFVSCRFEL
jgi:phospholipid/cholesterol/gamma-HCH transport system ATP-binding protein